MKIPKLSVLAAFTLFSLFPCLGWGDSGESELDQEVRKLVQSAGPATERSTSGSEGQVAAPVGANIAAASPVEPDFFPAPPEKRAWGGQGGSFRIDLKFSTNKVVEVYRRQRDGERWNEVGVDPSVIEGNWFWGEAKPGSGKKLLRLELPPPIGRADYLFANQKFEKLRSDPDWPSELMVQDLGTLGYYGGGVFHAD